MTDIIRDENQERSGKLFRSTINIYQIVCYISYLNTYTTYANTYHRVPTLSFVNCKWKLNKRKSLPFCFILESAVVRNEMEVVLRCENYVQVDALTVLDFTILYVVMRQLLLSSRVSPLVIVNILITNSE